MPPLATWRCCVFPHRRFALMPQNRGSGKGNSNHSAGRDKPKTIPPVPFSTFFSSQKQLVNSNVLSDQLSVTWYYLDLHHDKHIKILESGTCYKYSLFTPDTFVEQAQDDTEERTGWHRGENQLAWGKEPGQGSSTHPGWSYCFLAPFLSRCTWRVADSTAPKGNW